MDKGEKVPQADAEQQHAGCTTLVKHATIIGE